MNRLVFAMALYWITSISAAAAEGRIRRDLEYARPNGLPQALDLYLPPKQAGPLIVFVHGGAWRSGSKKEMPFAVLISNGYPVATIDYRLSTVAPFPAQAHDIKAAIRFLRGKADSFSIDASTIVISGTSAGGHLAALVGVSNGDKRLEGEEGDFKNRSSDVQAIVSFYGASDLTTILTQSTPHGLSVRVPALELLLGGKPEEKQELARLASPVFQVDKNDPPLLLFHGDQDPQMPVNQALQFQGAYEKVGAKAQLKILHGAGHGGKVFFEPEQIAIMKEFLRANFAK